MPTCETDVENPIEPQTESDLRRSSAIRRPLNGATNRKQSANKASTLRNAPARTKSSRRNPEPTLLGDFLLGRPSANRTRRKTSGVAPVEMKTSAVNKLQPPRGLNERVKQWQNASAAIDIEDPIRPASELGEDGGSSDRESERPSSHDISLTLKVKKKKIKSPLPPRTKATPMKRVVSDSHWIKNGKRTPPKKPDILLNLFVDPTTLKNKPAAKICNPKRLPKNFVESNWANPPLERKIKDWAERTEESDILPQKQKLKEVSKKDSRGDRNRRFSRQKLTKDFVESNFANPPHERKTNDRAEEPDIPPQKQKPKVISENDSRGDGNWGSSSRQKLPKDFVESNWANPPLERKIKDWAERTEESDIVPQKQKLKEVSKKYSRDDRYRRFSSRRKLPNDFVEPNFANPPHERKTQDRAEEPDIPPQKQKPKFISENDSRGDRNWGSSRQRLPKNFVESNWANPPLERKIQEWAERTEEPDIALQKQNPKAVSKTVLRGDGNRGNSSRQRPHGNVAGLGTPKRNQEDPVTEETMLTEPQSSPSSTHGFTSKDLPLVPQAQIHLVQTKNSNVERHKPSRQSFSSPSETLLSSISTEQEIPSKTLPLFPQTRSHRDRTKNGRHKTSRQSSSPPPKTRLSFISTAHKFPSKDLPLFPQTRSYPDRTNNGRHKTARQSSTPPPETLLSSFSTALGFSSKGPPLFPAQTNLRQTKDNNSKRHKISRPSSPPPETLLSSFSTARRFPSKDEPLFPRTRDHLDQTNNDNPGRRKASRQYSSPPTEAIMSSVSAAHGIPLKDLLLVPRTRIHLRQIKDSTAEHHKASNQSTSPLGKSTLSLSSASQSSSQDIGAPPPLAHKHKLWAGVPTSRTIGRCLKHRRSSSPLKHEYQPSHGSATSSSTYSSDSDSVYFTSESSEDGEIQAGKKQNALRPMEPASIPRVLLQPRQESYCVKFLAYISCWWVPPGRWDNLQLEVCLIAVTPGLIQAFVLNGSHSSPEHSKDATRPDQRPLLALVLTPIVLIRQSNGLDIEIHSPPLETSLLKCSHIVRFRSRNDQDCRALYAITHKARQDNEQYKSLQQQRMLHDYGRQADQVEVEDKVRYSWFGRKKNYGASARAPSFSGSDGSSFSLGTAFSALRRMSNGDGFNINRSTFNVGKFRTGAKSGASSLYTTSDSASLAFTGPRTPTDPSVATTGTRRTSAFDTSNLVIRLYRGESSSQWVEIGLCKITIRPAPPGMRQASSLYNGIPKRVTLTQFDNENSMKGLTKRFSIGDVCEENKSSSIFFDGVLGARCFSRLQRVGIVMNVWEEMIGPNGEIGMAAAVGGVSGRQRRWMFQCSNSAQAGWIFALLGSGA